MGYWTQNDNKNMRDFFDSFAHTFGFDPLIPDNWYNVPQKDVLQHVCKFDYAFLCNNNFIYKNGNGISVLYHYKNSVIKALLDVYPNIGLNISKFKIVNSMIIKLLLYFIYLINLV